MVFINLNKPFNLSACYYHFTCAIQSESTLFDSLNIKELLALNKHDIWGLSDSNGIQTHIPVSHPEETWGQRFQLGVFSTFLNTLQNFIDLYCFSLFLPLLFSCIRFSFERKTKKLIVYLRNLSDNDKFIFQSFS